ncbi:DUF6134 family protein [Phenylobacterium sp.]|jgi:hypothetical protein|uniref:DUF6134 family protein n=1 Tax=Phenylobacterium sp. TaxID=1871053 RepID=UPI002F411904
MPNAEVLLSRRLILAGGLILPIAPRLALAATPRNLSFAVFRNNSHIGEHHIAFAGDGAAVTATTDAIMTVKIGPVPVFRYHHHAVETRRDGLFATLETATTTNGKAERVEAERTDGAVRVDCATGKAVLAANVNPLTHWNPRIFDGPMFNPQTGKMMKVRVSRETTTRWAIRGEVEMDDTYDETGAWLAAKAKADDGSTIEYRRL